MQSNELYKNELVQAPCEVPREGCGNYQHCVMLSMPIGAGYDMFLVAVEEELQAYVIVECDVL